MEIIKKRFHIEEIIKIKYKKDVTLVYTKEKVYICVPHSEQQICNGLVEYTLKNLNTSNNGVHKNG